MPTSIKMPQLGESVESGTIGRWLKSVGEAIRQDEPLVEVVTDKVNVEIPSPAEGVVTRILVEEGQTVPVGTEIAVIDAPGSAGPEQPSSPEPSAAQPESQASEMSGPPPPDQPRQEAPAPASAVPTAASAGNGVGGVAVAGHARTSPLVRRLAKEHGIDLGQVTGTGLGGRVTRDDILAYIEKERGVEAVAASPAATAATTTATSAPARPAALERPVPAPAQTDRPARREPAQAGDTGDERWVPLTPLRQAIAEHMVRSISTAPHVTTCFEIDVSGIARARQALRDEFREREGFELTYLPFVAKAVVEALREHPTLNASFQSGQDGQQGISLKRRINLGIAVGLEDSLIVPVIRDADALSIAGLARAARDLAERARAGRLAPDDVRDGTFTLNNTGAFGSVKSNPIINGGQAAIITMESVVRRPVVVTRDGEETIAIRSMMMSCLSFDHRVLDGLQAGRFMQSVKRRLEGIGPDVTIY